MNGQRVDIIKASTVGHILFTNKLVQYTFFPFVKSLTLSILKETDQFLERFRLMIGWTLDNKQKVMIKLEPGSNG